MEGNWESVKPKKKWVKVVRRGMMEYGVNEEMVIYRDMWRENIWVANCVKLKQR